MRFSSQDFDKMLYELFVEEPARFDTLCLIAEQELLPVIESWCAQDMALSGRDVAFDIMQDTQLRLIKYCVTGFFLRDGRTEPNRDVSEFVRWIYTVARNVKRDYSNRSRARYYVDLDELGERIGEPETDDYAREEIAEAMDIVLNSNIGIHKLLAWLCIAVIILLETDKRSEATEILVDRLGDKTLFEMYSYFLKSLEAFPELALTGAQASSIEARLTETASDGRAVGEHRFSEFFMQKGGKYSVSDWIHKINLTVRRSIVW